MCQSCACPTNWFSVNICTLATLIPCLSLFLLAKSCSQVQVAPRQPTILLCVLFLKGSFVLPGLSPSWQRYFFAVPPRFKLNCGSPTIPSTPRGGITLPPCCRTARS